MRMWVAGILGCLACNSFAFSAVPLPSQLRAPGEAYSQALKRYLSRSHWTFISDSALSSAKPYDSSNWQSVHQWQRIAEVVDQFREARDRRFLSDSAHPSILRRSTWLYPDDGCFARSALVIENVERNTKVRIQKLFVFGELEVKTPNAINGRVAWWYHVVPVASSGKNIYVFDPALDPHTPILVDDWIGKMTDDASSVKCAICDGLAYEPSSSCNGDEAASKKAEQDQLYYLDLEWQRLEDLGRDPIEELGNSPPWAQPVEKNLSIAARLFEIIRSR